MTQTTYILWAVLATGGAVAVYLLMRREVAAWRLRFWSAIDGWREALSLCDFQRSRADDLEAKLLEARTLAMEARARSDHYASSWGRVMRLLRLAEQANKELRTELLRRENNDRIAA